MLHNGNYMNNKIKSLMLQAGFDPLVIELMGAMPRTEKFAELIIQECADICFDRDYATGDHYGEEIVKYFGVEQ